jgi:ribosomal protein L44E
MSDSLKTGQKRKLEEERPNGGKVNKLGGGGGGDKGRPSPPKKPNTGPSKPEKKDVSTLKCRVCGLKSKEMTTERQFYFELLLLLCTYLSEKDIRNLSYTSLENRKLILNFKLIKYRFNKLGSSRYAHEPNFRLLVDGRGQVISVKICGDHIINDISFLRNIQEVYLDACRAIEDVSPLSSAHTIYLRSCYGILDFSSLSGVDTLTIIQCNLRDVSPFASVRNLSLVCCDSVTDVKSLTSVNSLNLTYLQRVRDLDVLRTVKNLVLTGMFLTNEQTAILSKNVFNLTINNRRIII